jgi:hypothetical protein
MGLALLVLISATVAGLYFLFFARREQETAAYSVEVEAQASVLTGNTTTEDDFDGVSEVGFTDGSFAEHGFEETKFPVF